MVPPAREEPSLKPTTMAVIRTTLLRKKSTGLGACPLTKTQIAKVSDRFPGQHQLKFAAVLESHLRGQFDARNPLAPSSSGVVHTVVADLTSNSTVAIWLFTRSLTASSRVRTFGGASRPFSSFGF